jgi:hypothetical protein
VIRATTAEVFISETPMMTGLAPTKTKFEQHARCEFLEDLLSHFLI